MMLLETQWVLSFLVLGAFVGFMAGLLGIGGGGIMVPVLTTIFIYQGTPVEKVIHLALGTSMASIIVTSLSSMRAHNAKGAVVWNIVKIMSLGIILGTFVATFIAVNTRPLYLALFFSLFMAYVSSQMFLDKKPKASRKLAGSVGLLCAGSGIGAVSALVSIGGGSLTVPYLVWQNVDIKKAIGTSAAIGFPISIAGTAGYVMNGWTVTSGSEYTFGFVYAPAVLLISAASFITAPYGARLAHKIPVASLKKIFAFLLILLSLKMLFSVL
ncbi:sulfite exporter TauE/SafE family protein [Methylomonas koyamae]|nr:sulfite exporter TauE/SafE family protein [Methylomonas koyamae]